MKKLLFIMNPNAGMRKANRFMTEMIAVFNQHGYDVTVFITEAPGTNAQTVQRLAHQMDLIVCCGGDGTFSETVSSLQATGADIPVGYIPAGSTNDFANSLHLETNCVEAARRIMEGKPHSYDLGRFNGQYFAYVASFGAFTRASYATPQNMKNALGHTAYVLSGIQELSRIRKLPVRLELDGEVLEDEFIFGAVCNSTSVAGILTLDPNQVDLCDGKFEVLLVRAPKDLSEISECIAAIQKQQYNCKMITFRTASTIRINADPEMDWTLDGEMAPGSREILIQNLNKAFRLLH